MSGLVHLRCDCRGVSIEQLIDRSSTICAVGVVESCCGPQAKFKEGPSPASIEESCTASLKEEHQDSVCGVAPSAEALSRSTAGVDEEIRGAAGLRAREEGHLPDIHVCRAAARSLAKLAQRKGGQQRHARPELLIRERDYVKPQKCGSAAADNPSSHRRPCGKSYDCGILRLMRAVRGAAGTSHWGRFHEIP